MRYDWNLGHASMAMMPHRKIELVLIEYDGPQLAIFIDANKDRFLGLFGDLDGDTERWIHTPLSHLELEALCTTGITMRGAICKSQIEIIDYRRNREQRLWAVVPELVPQGVLPSAGACLPDVIGAAALKRLKIRKRIPQGEPFFRLDGRAVRGHSITFIGVSVVTQAIQKLWTAIANSILPPVQFNDQSIAARENSTTLAMAAGTGGSFGIKLESPDHDTFAAIADHYKTLMSIAPDFNVPILDTIAPTVVDAYLHYLRVLETHGLEVMTNWNNESAFISDRIAARVRPFVLKSRKKEPAASEAKESLSAKHGYFDEVSLIDKSFAFYNLQDGETITGTINSKLIQKMSETGTSVGRSTQYSIQLSTIGVKHELVNVERTQTNMFS